MITLHGARIQKGVAIAEAVVIPPAGGLADVPQDVLQRGIDALRRRTPESEMPEIILICQSIEDGVSLRVPGTKVAAIAAESPDVGNATCSTPSVAGLPNLLRDANSGEIAIVDGTRGIVYLEPDAESLIYYQSQNDHKIRRVFLESSHLPAVTQDGRTILVFALAAGAGEIPSALAEGADGVALTPEAVRAMNPGLWSQSISAAGGKYFVLLDSPDTLSLRVILSESLQGQITVVLNPENPTDLPAHIELVSSRLEDDGEEPVGITLAWMVRSGVQSPDDLSLTQASRLILDAGRCTVSLIREKLGQCIDDLLTHSGSPQEGGLPVTVVLRESVDAVRCLLPSVDSIVVPAGLVPVVKDLIRSFPPQEQ